MANEEHLARLQEGVEAWNQWRKEYPEIRPNLGGADLCAAHLTKADLSGARLTRADLSRANLSGANLLGADLAEADLSRANLLWANLFGANLSWANLAQATLIWVTLTQATLIWATLSQADLSQATLSQATIGWTIFGDVNLSSVRGLETVKHNGPSTIGIDTLYRSHGNIPEVFLRGAGVPKDFITYVKPLVGSPFEFYSCFISYSSKDQEFAERLYADLQSKGVRCWFAPEDLKIGEKFRPSIDEAIRLRDKLLLVLSTHSMASEWVETEVETAFAEENRRKKTILFPIRLDDTVIETHQAWAAHIHRTRHIGDFRQWKDHDAYQKAFQRLLHDLKADN